VADTTTITTCRQDLKSTLFHDFVMHTRKKYFFAITYLHRCFWQCSMCPNQIVWNCRKWLLYSTGENRNLWPNKISNFPEVKLENETFSFSWQKKPFVTPSFFMSFTQVPKSCICFGPSPRPSTASTLDLKGNLDCFLWLKAERDKIMALIFWDKKFFFLGSWVVWCDQGVERGFHSF
jgi:hypothetical protein